MNGSILSLPPLTEPMTPELISESLKTTPTKTLFSWVLESIATTKRALQRLIKPLQPT
ncbi:MAG: hypothetical protein O3A00_09000 [Planctomycetota bacterium]|nr:hypothetical protein [Planctomycetota bacterium]